jgi:RNA polymerase sigma-70 factor (ECF subfamily)
MTLDIPLANELGYRAALGEQDVPNPSWLDRIRSMVQGSAVPPAPPSAKGRAARDWQETRLSLLHRAGSAGARESSEALRSICEDYHAPLLTFARRLERDPDRAQEVVHSFVAAILEGKVVAHFEERKGRFRTYLRTALRNHAANLRKRERALKRGGSAAHDDVDPESMPGADLTADRLYDRAWAHAVIDRTKGRLREELQRRGKVALFDALGDRLEGDDGARPLRVVAQELGMREGNLKVALFRLRSRFHELVRADVSETTLDVDGEIADLCAALRGDP